MIRDELMTIIFPFVISGSLLEPLYTLSRMGHGRHAALARAWEQLEARRDADGHYPVERYPPSFFTPGPKGKPNRWATL